MFKYFGSKFRHAASYQAPRHGVIVEPFAGAAAYAMHWMRERPSLEAILVEADEHVVDLWDRLLDMSPHDILAMPDVKKGDTTTDLAVALSASSASPLGSMRNQGYATVTEWQEHDWPAVRRRMAWTRGLIGDRNRITLIHGDYTEAPDIEATWHIDPPYQHQGSPYHHGSEGIDYRFLANWCMSRQGQVMVCEAEPADWLPFTIHMSALDQTTTLKTELVWYNEPDLTLFDDDI